MSTEEVDRLVEGNLWLVEQSARRAYPSLCLDQDLLQAGRIGLWRAAERWDRVRPFRPFARACIRNAMRDHVRRMRTGQDTVTLDGLPPLSSSGGVDDEIVEQMDISARIRACWPANSREAFILTALSKGVSMGAVAAAMGLDVGQVRRVAKRAYEAIERAGGNE